MLVLLGVSSAQINATAKDVTEMGAHENSFQIPRLGFLKMAAATSYEVASRMQRKIREEPDSQQVKNWKQSMHYTTIIAEGTGILHPTPHPEDTLHARKVIEAHMPSDDDDVFFAWRREYWYTLAKTGFLKSAEKVFCGDALIHEGKPQELFRPSFLVMRKADGSTDDTPVGQLLTKSVDLAEFLQAGSPAGDEDVRLLMEPLLTEAEWISVFEGMKNIHPPPPLDAPHPGDDGASYREKCNSIVDSLLPSTELFPQEGVRSTITMVYYLRGSKVNPVTCQKLRDLMTKRLPSGLLLGWQVHREWVASTIGGYRFELLLDNDQVERLYARLPRGDS
jgi:hypothetical protein